MKHIFCLFCCVFILVISNNLAMAEKDVLNTPPANEAVESSSPSAISSEQPASDMADVPSPSVASLEKAPLPTKEQTENITKIIEQEFQKFTEQNEKALQKVDEEADRHVSLMSYGLTALAVFAALLTVFTGILALVGLGITYFTSRTYHAEIKVKEKVLTNCEKEMRELLAKGKGHVKEIEDLKLTVDNAPPVEKFDDKTISAAKEIKETNELTDPITSLRSSAMIAHNEENWKEAHVLWAAVLTYEPDDTTALFSCALACMQLFGLASKKENIYLLDEAEKYLLNIRPQDRNGAVFNNWGNIVTYRADVAEDLEEKNKLWNEAEKKFRKSIDLNPNSEIVWCNWGNLFLDRAKVAENLKEKNEFWDKAEEKFLSSLDLSPSYSNAYYNLACLKALQSDLENTLKNLKRCQELHFPGLLAKIKNDKDFDLVRNETAFVDFIKTLENSEA